MTRRVAVVGSGVAGLTAAYVLSRRDNDCRVTLYEADDRLGGHADTHAVDGPDGRLEIDTGFIVHNERTYPVLLRLFAELGVATQDSEMSMSISDRGTGLEWAGALGRRGVVPTARHLADPAYLRMLTAIPRFHRRARALLKDRVVSRRPWRASSTSGPTPSRSRLPWLRRDVTLRPRLRWLRRDEVPSRNLRTEAVDDVTPRPRLRWLRRDEVPSRSLRTEAVDDVTPRPRLRWLRRDEVPSRNLRTEAVDDVTLREFLDAGRFTPYFTRHFVEPLVAAVWSCDPGVALDYPARYLFRFLDHHGMLAVFGSPTWRTVTGGSREYVDRVAATIADVRTGTKITSVAETADGVEVTDGNGTVAAYDAVVIATHPHQALSMLAEPSRAQRDVLGAIPYSANTALLHTDTSLLPTTRNAWASWNFRRPAEAVPGRVTVTYDLTRLQRLPTDTHYLVTLGGEGLVDPATVIDRMEYEHPLYTPTSVAAQRRLPEIDTDRIVFAGAYHGWGFHEDGARSGLAAAERLGATWPQVSRRPWRASSTSGGLYDVTITHVRRTPFRRTFTHRSSMWLVDLDHLPDHGRSAWWRGSFEARDHLGDPDATLRENVQAFLALHGVELDGGTVLMAANARAFGNGFNPISVFWCFDDAGALAGVIVEVHNTYGDRHAYLVHPDEQGRASTDKAMYVSPFHGTDGSYELAVPVPGDRLQIAVTLHTDDGAAFSASVVGTRSSAGPLRAAPAALRGAALIRVHGIWLWARRLPVLARPHHPPQEKVQ